MVRDSDSIRLQPHVAIKGIYWTGDFSKLEVAVIRAGNAGSGQVNNMLGNGFESGSKIVT